MPEPGGHDLLREWQAAMRSLAGHADMPKQLLAPLQRQAELIQEILERERRLQRDVVNRLLGPADAIFDLLERADRAREDGGRRQAQHATGEAPPLAPRLSPWFPAGRVRRPADGRVRARRLPYVHAVTHVDPSRR